MLDMKYEDKQISVVKSIINNNIVIVKDFNGREVIAIGKGLGFKKHKNEFVYPHEVMKTYVLVGKTVNGMFTLFEEVPFDVIEIAQKIIDYASNQLGITFNVNLLSGLADHINFSMMQYKQGLQTSKLVNEEVKRFYKEEYLIGIYAVNLINEKFNIKLPKDEATSIAFHLITATENKSNHQALVIMQGVSDIIKIVENYLGSQLNEDTFIYSRFVIHLKFFLGSILSNQIENTNFELNSIFVRLNTKYKEVRICIQEITKYVLEHFHYHCRDEDCIYLMIHIVRLYERKGHKGD